jgi:hypothetical protein
MSVKANAGKEIWLAPTTDWQESPQYADWFDGKNLVWIVISISFRKKWTDGEG